MMYSRLLLNILPLLLMLKPACSYNDFIIKPDYKRIHRETQKMNRRLGEAKSVEDSCLHRLEKRFNPQPWLQNPLLTKLLEEYAQFHREAYAKVNFDWTSDLKRPVEKKEDIVHRYLIVNTDASGLGNRLNSVLSCFLWALLAKRVLLVYSPDFDYNDLFCQPFPGSSWLLPSSLTPDMIIKDYGKGQSKLHSIGAASFNREDVKRDILLGATVPTTQPNTHSGNTHQIIMHNHGEQYILPDFFQARDGVSDFVYQLFPRNNVAELLTKYLFHPRDLIWREILHTYDHMISLPVLAELEGDGGGGVSGGYHEINQVYVTKDNTTITITSHHHQGPAAATGDGNSNKKDHNHHMQQQHYHYHNHHPSSPSPPPATAATKEGEKKENKKEQEAGRNYEPILEKAMRQASNHSISTASSIAAAAREEEEEEEEYNILTYNPRPTIAVQGRDGIDREMHCFSHSSLLANWPNNTHIFVASMYPVQEKLRKVIPASWSITQVFQDKTQENSAVQGYHALHDIWLLSMMDEMILSPRSTFGYFAQALHGRPAIYPYPPVDARKLCPEVKDDQVCYREKSSEPCFHHGFGPDKSDYWGHRWNETFIECEDLICDNRSWGGIKLQVIY